MSDSCPVCYSSHVSTTVLADKFTYRPEYGTPAILTAHLPQYTCEECGAAWLEDDDEHAARDEAINTHLATIRHA